ncbi:MAG: efflux RND transporter periplasmic adaptor subunit [Acidobacteriaceae bacterium]
MSLEESRDAGSRGEDAGRPSTSRDGQVSPTSQERGHSTQTPAEKKSSKGLWIKLAIGALLAAALVYWMTRPYGNNNPAAGHTSRFGSGPAAITANITTTGSISEYVEALGTVTPISTITLYSQVTGIVMAVHYQEGQYVHKGDPLVDIDPRPYQSTLDAAEGQLLHDQGVLAEAQMDLQRYREAWAQNAIQKQELDDQEKMVIQDEGTVKQDQGTVAYDKVELSYCHIVAPIDGRVGLRLVDPGNTVFSGNNSTLVVLTQLQPITVVFEVSEDDLPEVQAQLKTNHAMRVDAFDREDVKNLGTGKLIALDNEVDTTTGTVKFRATFPNKDMALFPNQFVNARLLVKTLTNATLAPTAAVQYNGTAAFVYVVNPNQTVSVHPVQVVTSNERVTAVTGIDPGVTVAISGFDRLEDGAKVQVRNKPREAKPLRGLGPGSTRSSTSTPAPGSPASSGSNSPAATTSASIGSSTGGSAAS